MKSFISASLITVCILLLFLIYGNDTFYHKSDIPYDDEQHRLKEQIVIRFSHVVAENTPKGLAAQKFAELVDQKTNGQVRVEVYPNGILYSDEEEAVALSNGEVEMIAPSFSKMTELVPKWKVLDLPFIFRDDDHVKAVFTGQTGAELLKMLNVKQMKGLAFWSNGFKHMTSSRKPLLEPDDFKGQVFRVMPGEVIEEQFHLLHAESVVTSFNEVYRSLETQEVDGQENTISNIYSKSLYKVQKNLTLSNHGYLGYAVIINNEFWNKLSPDIQKQIQAAMKETTNWIFDESKQMNESQLEDIKQHGYINIYELPDENKEKWIQTFQPLYEKVSEDVGKELINKIKEAGL
jgi:tripartite ATP-independent transporter DctP family solute receptor